MTVLTMYAVVGRCDNVVLRHPENLFRTSLASYGGREWDIRCPYCRGHHNAKMVGEPGEKVLDDDTYRLLAKILD